MQTKVGDKIEIEYLGDNKTKITVTRNGINNVEVFKNIEVFKTEPPVCEDILDCAYVALDDYFDKNIVVADSKVNIIDYSGIIDEDKLDAFISDNSYDIPEAFHYKLGVGVSKGISKLYNSFFGVDGRKELDVFEVLHIVNNEYAIISKDNNANWCIMVKLNCLEKVHE